MKAYKYRENYNRDIKLLANSKIYTPPLFELNDPFEGMINPKIFDDYELLRPHLSPSEYERKISLQEKLLIQIEYVGVYSLSKTWNNELLWVHYSDSHKGFCIEYEMNDFILEKTRTLLFPKIIEVDYSKVPPIYSLYSSDDLEVKIFKRLIGTKSKPWKYEKEIRVIFKENGVQEINQKSLKSIIFGLHASEEDINKTIISLPKNTKYYKIEILKRSYKLIKKRI